MNLDLLASPRAVGILSDTPFEGRVVCALFDRQDHSLTLEFGDMGEPVRCNVPIDSELADRLAGSRHLMIGIVRKGKLASVEEVRLLTLDTARYDEDE